MTDRGNRHVAVVSTQAFVVRGGVLGFLLMIYAITLPSTAVIIGAACGTTVVLELAVRRFWRGGWVSSETIPWSAKVPAYAAALTFLIYGLVLLVVHIHYYGQTTQRYAVQTATELVQVKAHNAPLDAQFHAVTAQVDAELETQKACNPKDPHVLAEVEQTIRAHPNSTPDVDQLIHKACGVPNLTQHLNEQTQLLEKLSIPHIREEPSKESFPPWFGELGDFFTGGAQILAVLLIALAFTRWANRIADQVVRAAMPFVVLGLIAGIVGTLPNVPRGVQAGLLGLVAAGMVGALGALSVSALGWLDVKDDRAPDQPDGS